jgi:hypothetical protein
VTDDPSAGRYSGPVTTPQDPVDPAAAAGAAADPAPPEQVPEGPSHLARQLAVYTVLRLALVIALTAVLAFFMPLIVALLFAIIVQLPLAWLLFSGPRARVNDAMAQASARRRAERARLQSALSGETDS